MTTPLFDECRQRQDFVPLTGLQHVVLDLRYACPRNILGRDLYEGETEAWLQRDAAEALARAAVRLQLRRPGWKLRVYDATRPHSVQELLFAKVRGTSQQAYVADPAHGSVHNFGYAVDLCLQTDQGWEADHGTGFDSFEDRAQPQLENAIFQQGRLNAEQIGLRRLLRELMEAEGFKAHPMEWWHFEFRSLGEIKAQRDPIVRGLPIPTQ
jgi:D-alanyl-D-alanine dipeptidase